MKSYRHITFLTLLASNVLAPAAQANDERVDLAALPRIAQVDPRFQSYNVEMAEIIGGRFWAPYPKPGQKGLAENTQASGGLALQPNLFRQRPPVDLANRRLLNLARALGPAYIRVSGTWANSVYFQDDGLTKLAKAPKGFQTVLTRQQWAGVIAFAKAVDGRLTTSFAASGGVRDADGLWTPAEARKLLRFTRKLGGDIYAAELINEPNLGSISGLPPRYDSARFARDLAAFRAFAAEEAPGMKIVGPGSSGEENGRGPFPGAIDTQAMLSSDPPPKFDVFSYHFYGALSERCSKMAPDGGILPENALAEEWLGRTDHAFAFYRGLRDRYVPDAPIWLNETAQASCGGDKWAATYLDSFRYVDQLGRLARLGVSAVFHNTLAASDYGLIDETSLTPRPNYWAALLWRRLMGPIVLKADSGQRGLHLYAHCLRDRPGGVALVVLNLDRNSASAIALSAPAQRFMLTADDLAGSAVELNGKPLKLVGDALPRLEPAKVAAGVVQLPPASITFLAVPTAGNAACR